MLPVLRTEAVADDRPDEPVSTTWPVDGLTRCTDESLHMGKPDIAADGADLLGLFEQLTCSSAGRRSRFALMDLLVEELADATGVLSYSSLELRNGNWCNLVLLSDAEAKTGIKGREMHKYAAYHLAHSYYEWIRLHTGIMPEGLDHTEMLLQKTKYYFFEEPQKRPTIRERVYGPGR